LLDFNLTHEVSPQPPRVGQTTITLRLTDHSHKPITGAHVTVEGNMSHAGMAPAVGTATEVEPGVYRAIIELSMPGDWVVIAHAVLPDGRRVGHQFELNAVAGT
jgi:YtkA-like